MLCFYWAKRTKGSWLIIANERVLLNLQLSAMDVSDLVTMKDAANCDTQCDLQTSENH